ncbi:unnamed protein product [Dracunculus medinensis]|uniref:EAL domain-containing protein n=1 Tax=Dracunculus medinensis TaxID=318479 RepID=A0A0N4UR65_DRAME|nr:unnamed protein product [Dracunculus medinensis]
MLERDSVPEKISRLIKAFYERTSEQIYVYEELIGFFEIRTGSVKDVCFPYNIQLCDRLDNEHRLPGIKWCANQSRV